MSWKNDYEQMLLDASQYSGESKKEQKVISASSLGNDMLQNYYRFKYGVKEDTKYGQNTMGSIYQMGVDAAAHESPQYLSAIRFSHELSNGWTVSGEIDQYDTINNVIIDNKMTTTTTIKNTRREGKDSGYALQLGVYKMLMVRNGTMDEPTCALAYADKKASFFSKTPTVPLVLDEVETYTPDEIEQMLLDKTNELQDFLVNNKEPDECKNLFPYKVAGKTKRMKCLHYCDYADECTHYKDDDHAIKKIMDEL